MEWKSNPERIKGWILFSDAGQKLDSLTFDQASSHYRDSQGQSVARNFADAVAVLESRSTQAVAKRKAKK